MVTDRGLNNRGVFAKELSAAGVYCASIGLEAPYQLGKVERHGDIWKTIAAKVIENKSIRGARAMATVAGEVTAVVNEKTEQEDFRQHNGFLENYRDMELENKVVTNLQDNMEVLKKGLTRLLSLENEWQLGMKRRRPMYMQILQNISRKPC